MRRVSVVGSTGTGKTTYARRLAEILDVPHTELDAIVWQPSWTPLPPDEFRARVAERIADPGWVVDGNYGGAEVRPMVWSLADTIIWLDFSLPVIYRRLLLRTFDRVRDGRELWPGTGNRESIRNAFFSRESLFWWALKTYWRRKRNYTALFARPEYAHATRLRFRTPAEADRWLAAQRTLGPAHTHVMATLAADRPAITARVLPGFDYLFVAASAWLLGGLYWDGWAHGYGLPDTFWTIWHAAFYAGFGAVAVVLFTAIARARPNARSWRGAIPAGYDLAVLGAIVFAFGGAFDAGWHMAFGIETSTDALLSPSHLVLGSGIALMVSGPLAAAWRRGQRGDLVAQLPAVLSLTGLLCVFTFFSLFAGPYSGVLGQGPRPTEAVLVRTLLGMYLFSALVVGLSLVALRRGTLPAGAFTVMLGINAIAMILARGHAPFGIQATFMGVAIVAGIAGDVLVLRLRPGPDRVGATRIFAFALPVVYFGLYFAAVILGVGSGWTVPALTGSVLLSGIVGLFLSVVFVGGNAPPRAA